MATSDDANPSPRRIPPIRLRMIVTAIVLVAVGVVARKAWESMHANLLASPRYKLSAATLHISPETPPWIRTDVKAEVLRDSGLTDSLSLLESPEVIQQRLVDTFELHPWIRKVDSVVLARPGEIEMTVAYRQPVAVAEVSAAGQTDLLPIDAEAVRLPDGHLTEVEKSYLPRISDIHQRPLEGDTWGDARVLGAARLAARLGPVWEKFSLLDIVPSGHPEVLRSNRYYVYDIRSNYGTVIHWGAAPGFAPPGESPFEEKLARLTNWIDQNGSLDSINSPQSIDVRDSLYVEKRIAKQPESEDLVR
ncbi:hypothetical protein NG895_28640 [Aeoliella sp. ICT_H6.2]|uniref:Cell division protein FtsQ n=1 Tax=Aeoliella straminimaris TaxID=2954799 RepID=A0A9X2JJH7_9BACT|nr:hypothetical protein [Aeoliella straminimaris]MCO6047891.1 hypothetical protein [Aeoliella straminimaris]